MMGNWTRSYQRVEGHPVIVDVRPGAPSMVIYTGTPTARQLPGRRESAIAMAVKDRLADLWPATRITTRVDTGVRLGDNDMIDTLSRALRSHLAGYNVEDMGDL